MISLVTLISVENLISKQGKELEPQHTTFPLLPTDLQISPLPVKESHLELFSPMDTNPDNNYMHYLLDFVF